MAGRRPGTQYEGDEYGGISRRDFVAWSLTAALGPSVPASLRSPVAEANVDVKTPDGVCDALFIHPATGSHPGVLVWHDSPGVRPAIRDLGRRIAAEGYAALVPNLFYRMARVPVFPRSLDMANSAADRAEYGRIVRPFLAAGAAERDAVAYVAFLDAQPQVDTSRKIGTQGYCLGGPYVLKAAAAVPDRVGAAASFHGGFMATEQSDSPHLLAPKIRAELYIAIASDDDQREPHVKDQLTAAFAAAKARAEVEVYPKARHGWCVPDSKAAENAEDAERAWAKLVALYRRAL